MESYLSLDTTVIQILMGVVLFFLINILGKRSNYMGYMQISLFAKTSEAPAFNLLFRVLTPLVYIIIITTIFFKIGFDKYTVNIYMVNIYYIIFRWTFNLIMGRGRLLNWLEQFIHFIVISTLSFIEYRWLIKEKANILPDLSTISNELWIIIVLFLYSILNRLELGRGKTEYRKKRYQKHYLQKYMSRFDGIIRKRTTNRKLISLIYAIMLYEGFNRPKIYRKIENAIFSLGIVKTTGIMQVKSNSALSDNESVKAAIKKINAKLPILIEEVKSEQSKYRSSLTAYGGMLNEDQLAAYFDRSLEDKILSAYNPGWEYSSEVKEIRESVERIIFGDSQALFYINWEIPK